MKYILVFHPFGIVQKAHVKNCSRQFFDLDFSGIECMPIYALQYPPIVYRIVYRNAPGPL
jgi:hypothetical protein